MLPIVFALLACRAESPAPRAAAVAEAPVEAPVAQPEPPPTIVEPAAPAPVPPPPAAPLGVTRRPSPLADEANARAIVRGLRDDLAAARKKKKKKQRREAELTEAELESAIVTLAVALCDGIAAPRIDAAGRLPSLVAQSHDLEDAIDPRAFDRCIREGGSEADCELIAGQPEAELGNAQTEIERARARAAIATLAAECSPTDVDLAAP